MTRAFLFVALLLAPAAYAQQAQPSQEELQARYLIETGQLRTALGEAHAIIIKLRKENAELKAKGETKPEQKK